MRDWRFWRFLCFIQAVQSPWWVCFWYHIVGLHISTQAFSGFFQITMVHKEPCFSLGTRPTVLLPCPSLLLPIFSGVRVHLKLTRFVISESSHRVSWADCFMAVWYLHCEGNIEAENTPSVCHFLFFLPTCGFKKPPSSLSVCMSRTGSAYTHLLLSALCCLFWKNYFLLVCHQLLLIVQEQKRWGVLTGTAPEMRVISRPLWSSASVRVWVLTHKVTWFSDL